MKLTDAQAIWLAIRASLDLIKTDPNLSAGEMRPPKNINILQLLAQLKISSVVGGVIAVSSFSNLWSWLVFLAVSCSFSSSSFSTLSKAASFSSS
eukprot:CAMPEP_0182462342 /NCGR_PEP_ID=MMETSP1319-20130603/6646_1 /TAXON_ID=172717 /ORGANISM="Bolidomonas pacifica, Strain RCC208" /LENGTH=94 /DNA_ID=CAMNT_0024661765 /DNA_START=68 /DNA_END=349 /DNA_ORIENTATION=-